MIRTRSSRIANRCLTTRANVPEGYSRANTDPQVDFPISLLCPPAITSALTPVKFRGVVSCFETRTFCAHLYIQELKI